MSSPRTSPREPLDKLKDNPVFQNLRAMAETHQLKLRPKESLRLQNNGTLDSVLDLRTESTWNSLRDCRANGMNQNEAQEVAFPNMLLPSESEQEQERLEQEEAEQKPRESP
jgi:hypothetical protein